MPEPRPSTQYQAGETPIPFTLDCGHVAGTIHHDAGQVPYLLRVDECGNSWRIYGYAQVSCQCGGGGEWTPNKAGMLKVIDAWQKRRAIAKQAAAALD